MSVQVIRRNGKREWAVIPYDEYERLRDAAELAEDAELARKALERNEEFFPVEVVDRLLGGENPIRVFRNHRGMTQRQLAKDVGIDPAYLSQIETGKRTGSTRVLRAIATALGVDLDDIVGDG